MDDILKQGETLGNLPVTGLLGVIVIVLLGVLAFMWRELKASRAETQVERDRVYKMQEDHVNEMKLQIAALRAKGA